MKMQRNKKTGSYIASYKNKTAIASTRASAFYALIAMIDPSHYDNLIKQ